MVDGDGGFDYCACDDALLRQRLVQASAAMMADGDGGDDEYDDDHDAVEHDGDDGALPKQRLAQAKTQRVPCPSNATPNPHVVLRDF